MSPVLIDTPAVSKFGEIGNHIKFKKGKRNHIQIYLRSITFNAHQDAESVAFSNSEAYSSSSMSRNNNNNATVAATDLGRNQQQTLSGMVPHHQVYGNGGGGGSSVRVKSERDTAAMAFHEQYSNQEDLMSALLKQV